MESASLAARSTGRAALRAASQYNVGLCVIGTLVAAALLYAAFPANHVGTDGLYPLIWGQDIASGVAPELTGRYASTPHPLSNLLGVALAPLGDHAEDGAVLLNVVSLATYGLAVYLLASAWFGRTVAVIATALIMTRGSVIGLGLDANSDTLFAALVLFALYVETRKRRAGVPVLALLAVGGLLRPEGWAFAGVYALYLWWDPGKRDLPSAALVVAPPLLWCLGDLVLAGNALHSFTGTRDLAEELNRDTGPVSAVTLLPGKLSDILSKVVLLCAGVGGVLAAAFLLRRSRILLAALAVSLGTFIVLGSAGFSVLGRYLLVPDALLAMLVGVALAGWSLATLPKRVRYGWIAVSAVLSLAILAFVPTWARELDDRRADLKEANAYRSDLRRLMDSRPLPQSSEPVTVPKLGMIPVFALAADVPLHRIENGGADHPSTGWFLTPSSEGVRRFLVDGLQSPPQGAKRVAANGSWALHRKERIGPASR